MPFLFDDVPVFSTQFFSSSQEFFEISFLKYFSVVNFNSRNSPKRGKPIIVVDMFCPQKIVVETILTEKKLSV